MCGFAWTKYLKCVAACTPDGNVSPVQYRTNPCSGSVDLADIIASGNLTNLNQGKCPIGTEQGNDQ